MRRWVWTSTGRRSPSWSSSASRRSGERRMIVWAAIAPHGDPVFKQPDGPTRKGMEGLERRLAEAAVEAVIVVTPHGTHVDGHFGVVRAATLSEHASQFADGEP